MKLIATKLSMIPVLIFGLYFCDVIGSKSDITLPDKVLSRKRRYLIFPKGSSIQLVYDSVVTIPDYTIYAVTGVTVALAWGLPDKPVYPEDLMQQYEDGDLPLLLHRADVNVTKNVPMKQMNATNSAIDKKATKIDNQTLLRLIQLFYSGVRPTQNPYQSAANVNYYSNNFDKHDYWNASRTANTTNRYPHSNMPTLNNYYYYNNNNRPPLAATQSSIASNYVDRYANNAFKKYLAETYIKPWVDVAWKKQSTEKSTEPTTQPPFKPKINKLHTIYPAMGKRSVRSTNMTWKEKFYLDHHRTTRHQLYEKIEKYLFAKGYNGTACVLKTLCEVRKKRSDSEPGSFLAEIVRAIFSLPEAQTNRMIDKRHVLYDEAHQSADNCMQKFINCPGSIWNAGFKLTHLQ